MRFFVFELLRCKDISVFHFYVLIINTRYVLKTLLVILTGATFIDVVIDLKYVIELFHDYLFRRLKLMEM